MDIAAIFDVITGLLSLGIVLVGVWVRKLTDTISGLRSSIDRLAQDNDREHGAVMDATRDLSREITTEVRGIVKQHSDHDKQNTRIETKVDHIAKRQVEIHQTINNNN